MSKYHPLDVRHPDNRDRERNSYLLAPPDDSTYALPGVQAPVQVASRRSADYRRNGSATTTTPPPAPQSTGSADPWGGSGTRAAPAPAATAPRRRSSLPKLLIFAVIAFVILRNTGLWEQLSRFVSRTAFELGLY